MRFSISNEYRVTNVRPVVSSIELLQEISMIVQDVQIRTTLILIARVVDSWARIVEKTKRVER